MINGIYRPDSGVIAVKGKVGALIEVGAGFHPLLSGRENIYVSASILGMNNQEIEGKIASIIRFAELGDFIDMPVKNYSSGMYVRLGFSIVAHLDPDILLIDEVLAVGDTAFRSKCYQAIDRLRGNCAIAFVGHNMQQMTRVCDRAIVLESGKVGYEGEVSSAIAYFNEGVVKDLDLQREEAGTGQAQVLEFLVSVDGEVRKEVSHGEDLEISVTLELENDLEDIVINLSFTNAEEFLVLQCTNQGFMRVDLPAGETCYKTLIPSLPLVSGIYKMSLLVQSADLLVPYAWIKNIQKMTVQSEVASNAPIRLPVTWHQDTVQRM
jgi:lipopolysaccharide transport system ATP-binding protein